MSWPTSEGVIEALVERIKVDGDAYVVALALAVHQFESPGWLASIAEKRIAGESETSETASMLLLAASIAASWRREKADMDRLRTLLEQVAKHPELRSVAFELLQTIPQPAPIQ